MKLDNKFLHQKCQSVRFDNPIENLRTAQHLIQLMMRESGIGLAANQAGINKRLFVMYVNREIFHCFNPEIISIGNDNIVMTEGCLSYPGQRLDIQRPGTINVRYYNARGIEYTEEFSGIAARCFQHELDHLNGITMYQRQKVEND